jgi:DNA-directed RNA polymerase subunit RPC12/RpoP
MSSFLGKKLARELELEYVCERCHQAPATEMFDNRFVCSPCRRDLEEKLVRNG